MEIKSFIAQGTVVKADRTTGEIVAIANSGNVKDRQGDVMLPGCWRKVIAEGQQPAVCWSHDVSDVRGKVVALEELAPGDNRLPLNRTGGKDSGKASGLLFKAIMAMETEAGRDAFALLKGDFIRQFSVQFSIADDGEKSERDGTREIKLVDQLFEISPVLVGASPGTALLTAKALDLASLLKGDGKPEEAELKQATHDLVVAMGAQCAEMDVDKAFALLEQELQSERNSRTADETLDFEAIGKEEELGTERVTIMLQASQLNKAKFQMSDGKYPINNCSDVSDAWKLRGRSTNWSSAQVARLVRRAASALNCSGPWSDGKALEIEKHDKPGRIKLQKMHDAAMVVHAQAAELGAYCECNVETIDKEKSFTGEPTVQVPAHVFAYAELLGRAHAAGQLAAHEFIGERH